MQTTQTAQISLDNIRELHNENGQIIYYFFEDLTEYLKDLTGVIFNNNYEIEEMVRGDLDIDCSGLGFDSEAGGFEVHTLGGSNKERLEVFISDLNAAFFFLGR